MHKSILLSLLLLLFVHPAWADNVSFTFDIRNAPGGIGSFSWTITAPSLNDSMNTQAWNAASNPTLGGGCKIARIALEAQNQAYGFTTFFSPRCDGLYDSETGGVAVSTTQFGTYSWWGTNPDNTKFFETLTISKTDLPVTAPEASVFTLLLAGIAGVAGLAYWRRSPALLRRLSR
jgi:hypothetical protein